MVRSVLAVPPTSVQPVYRGIDDLIVAGRYVNRALPLVCDDNAPPYIHMAEEAQVEYLDLWEGESGPYPAIRRMRQRGYRPAEDFETLLDGIRHPDKLEEGHPVFILGSIWESTNTGEACVLKLQRHLDFRELYLVKFGGWWKMEFRFAAVKLP